MRIGFTGTQIGMSLHQKEQFGLFIFELEPTEFHHGDCIGADADAHDIIRMISPNCDIIIHPPIIENKRAFKYGTFIYPQKDYIKRNHDIVNSVDYMIATPSSDVEELRSGTWATVRYARKQSVGLYLLKR